MKSLQEELGARGFIALSNNTDTADVDIFRVTPNRNEITTFPPVAHISYSDIKGKNGSQVLEFVISKLPKNE